MTDGDAGIAGVLAMLLISVSMVVAVALLTGSQIVVARVEAANAADAAALAAAPVTFRPFGAMGSPAAEAARLAKSNGAGLLRCRCPVDRSMQTRTVEVEVVVVRHVWIMGSVSVKATGRAEFDPSQLLSSDP